MRIIPALVALLCALAPSADARSSVHVRDESSPLAQPFTQVRTHKSAALERLHPRDGVLNRVLRDVYRKRAESRVLEGKKLPSAQWHTATVDHFNAQDVRTWQQKYYVDDSHYGATQSAPVYLTLQGEGPLSADYIDGTMAISYAQSTQALVVALEHRFYGDSQPTGDLSMDSLKYLSSQQALADIADFRGAIVANSSWPHVDETTPFFIMGGSYSGALAAWARVKYPTAFDGAIATSAPILAKEDFFEYLQVVEVALKMSAIGGSDSCFNTASAGILGIEKSLNSGSAGRAAIASAFNTCKPIATDKDAANAMSTVIGTFQGIVQYNNPEAGNQNVDWVCQKLAAGASNATQAVIDLTTTVNGGGSCMSVNYQDMISEMKDESVTSSSASTRSWMYQCCRQFAYWQTTNQPDGSFGSSLTLDFYNGMCSDAFGLSSPIPVDFTNEYYGGNDPQGTKILFPGGDVDPWSNPDVPALSINANVSTPGLPTTEIININPIGSHCQNMMATEDFPQLQKQKQDIQNQLDAWYAEI